MENRKLRGHFKDEHLLPEQKQENTQVREGCLSHIAKRDYRTIYTAYLTAV